ncbi:hypothetical protein RSAG8_06814, partial [Rhizoctonia solani AG-8 WAC10335]
MLLGPKRSPKGLREKGIEPLANRVCFFFGND